MNNTAIASAKYPGWTAERSVSGSRESWLMTHREYIGYAVDVMKGANGFFAELLSLQYCAMGGSRAFEPMKSQFSGSPAEVIAEAERRGKYWEGK